MYGWNESDTQKRALLELKWIITREHDLSPSPSFDKCEIDIFKKRERMANRHTYNKNNRLKLIVRSTEWLKGSVECNEPNAHALSPVHRIRVGLFLFNILIDIVRSSVCFSRLHSRQLSTFNKMLRLYSKK